MGIPARPLRTCKTDTKNRFTSWATNTKYKCVEKRVPQRQESVLEDQSTAVQKPPEKCPHEITLWPLASSRMSFLQVRMPLHIRRRVLISALESGRATIKKSDQRWWHHLGCVSEDVGPPDSSAILRKGTNILAQIRRLQFTRSALRHANTRENKSPSPSKIQVKFPHQRSPYAAKLEEKSQDETEDKSDAPVEIHVETCQEHL